MGLPAHGKGKAVASLTEVAAAEQACTRCDLYRGATQAVPGEGPAKARIMMVGEQPGDREDLTGQPFVGPAGRVLDRALGEAGIDRTSVFVTNAVKHFKNEPRGKRRLHKRPNSYEIDRCRWWLDLERHFVEPELIVALGATAARALFGRAITISRLRGKISKLDDGTEVLVTVHPSALLRIRDDATRRRQFGTFVEDLKQAVEVLQSH